MGLKLKNILPNKKFKIVLLSSICFLFASPVTAAPYTNSWFVDVPSSDPNYAYIADLYNLNKVSGIGNNRFGPHDALTRAQFVTMVEKAFNVQSHPLQWIPFADVYPGDWYYQQVVDAYVTGITAGISPTEFAPNSYVTREQAAQMLLHYLGSSIPPNPNANKMDVSDADDWAKAAVANVLAYGFRAEGIANVSYRSKSVMTRGEACALIDLIYHYVSNTAAPKVSSLPTPLPPVNQSNIVPTSDGARTFVNITSNYRPVNDPEILALFKKVRFTVDTNNNVMVSIPNCGSLTWTVLSYTGKSNWQGSVEKTINLTNPMDFTIILADQTTKRTLITVYAQSRNGQWYAQYR